MFAGTLDALDLALLFGEREVISTAAMARPDWLDLRRTGLGGSDVAAIFAVDQYHSGMDLWLNKTGQVPDRDLSDNEAVHWGNVLEDVVAREFSERTGWVVFNPEAIVRHGDHPCAFASPDRLFKDDDGQIGLLEAKTAGHFQASKWDDGAIPEAYELQVLHYLAVTGLPYAYIAVLIAGQRFQYQRIDRDDEVIADLLAVEADWWADYVVARVPPPVDASERCTEVLQSLWDAKDVTVQLDVGALDVAGAYLAATEAEKEAKDAKRLAGNQLRAMLGEAEVGQYGTDKICSWRPVKAFDEASFVAAEPDLAAAFMVPRLDRDALAAAHPNVVKDWKRDGARRLHVPKLEVVR